MMLYVDLAMLYAAFWIHLIADAPELPWQD